MSERNRSINAAINLAKDLTRSTNLEPKRDHLVKLLEELRDERDEMSETLRAVDIAASVTTTGTDNPDYGTFVDGWNNAMALIAGALDGKGSLPECPTCGESNALYCECGRIDDER